MSARSRPPGRPVRAERPLLLVGAALALATIAAAVAAPEAVLTGWRAAAVAAAALPLGALMLLAAMRLVPGAWSEAMRPAVEGATLLTPAALIAFLPVLVGLWRIDPWANAAPAGVRGVLLSPAVAVAVALAEFALAIVLAARIRMRRRSAATAALGLVALAPLTHLAAIQWLMSLAPDHASASIGLQFILRALIVAWCALLILRLGIGRAPRATGVLGGVLLALLVAWAYLAFMAYLVDWSSNLPENAAWYAARANWSGAALAFMLLHALPALALFAAPLRRSPRHLRRLAAIVLLGQLTELAWIALPGTGAAGILAYTAGLGALTCLTAAALPLALRRRIRARTP